MNEDEVIAILERDPGNSVFADYAQALHAGERSADAVITCLRGLTHNPSFHKGRLLLAKLFYDLGFLSFCLEQLRVIAEAIPDNKSLRKLLNKLAPSDDSVKNSSSQNISHTYAEVEFNLGDVDLIEDQGEQ